MIVVALQDAERGSGTDAAVFQEFKQAAVTLVNSAHGVGLFEGGVGEQNESASPTARRTFHLAQVAVRTRAAGTKLCKELGLEIRGDSMLEALGFVVNLPPFHSKDF